MIKINEVIIVEGKYDKIKLDSIIDATIIDVGGFSIYKDKERLNLIRRLAEKRDIIILTDSDRAGFQIRTYLCNGIDENKIKHAYIPDISGKESRKRKPSKEGTLGVEGVSSEVILNALSLAGVTASQTKTKSNQRKITKADLFEDGISGGTNSTKLRQELLRKLNLPSALSTNRLIEVLNIFNTYEEYKKSVEEIKEN